MRRWMFNVGFTLSFIIIFAAIIVAYSKHFVAALSSSSTDLWTISLQQDWTEDVRNFQLKKGEVAQEVPVLLYHRVIDDNDITEAHFNGNNDIQETIVLKSEFEKQIEFLRKEGFVTLTAKELQLFIAGELDVPKKSVVITFDDGFKDNVAVAYSVLRRNKFTAINFVISGAITKDDSPFDPEKSQYFSVADMKRARSVFEFESHTFNLHQKTEEGQSFLVAKTAEEVEVDVQRSIDVLNGNRRAFAYPYGEYNEETISVLKKLGFEMAFAVEFENANRTTNLFEIPRKIVLPSHTIEDFIYLVTAND